jgi:hypothetical protein
MGDAAKSKRLAAWAASLRDRNEEEEWRSPLADFKRQRCSKWTMKGPCVNRVGEEAMGDSLTGTMLTFVADPVSRRLPLPALGSYRMMFEAMISLLTMALVAARAVNLLGEPSR